MSRQLGAHIGKSSQVKNKIEEIEVTATKSLTILCSMGMDVSTTEKEM